MGKSQGGCKQLHEGMGFCAPQFDHCYKKGFSSPQLQGATWPSWHRMRPAHLHRGIPSLIACVGGTHTDRDCSEDSSSQN